MQSWTRIGFSFLFIAHLNSIGLAQLGTITTYAGPQLPLDGAWATTQVIDGASSVVSDGVGGFYVASLTQNRVYRVTADGRLSVIAGTGANGFSGDGGPAASARLQYPSGVTVDTAGNLFIADSGNHRIRKVTPSRIISTIAGNGNPGYGGDGGPATSARLQYPSGVTVDTAGNLFIADTNNNSIRKVTPGGAIGTVAGTVVNGYSGDGGPAASAQLNSPSGVALDAAGNLLIADTDNHRIRKVTPGGVISTVAGNGTSGRGGNNGPATSANLHSPQGVAVDTAGNLFIADTQNSCVRKVAPDGIISNAAGDGTYGYSGDGGQANFGAQLYAPTGVTIDAAGNLLIADFGNNCIRKVAPDGILSTAAGSGNNRRDGAFYNFGLPPTAALLHGPSGLAVDAAGNLFIADTENHRIRKVIPGGVISTVVGNGIHAYGGDGGPATAAWLYWPGDVVVDPAGSLFIADGNNNRVRKVTPEGVISTVAGNGTGGFSGDGGPATSAQLKSPSGVTVDAAGNLFIADPGNHRVRKVTPGGTISTVAGSGFSGGSGGDGGPATSVTLFLPREIAVDLSGNLFIGEPNKVRKVTPSGIISTVAGNGSNGYGGDGGQAVSAMLDGIGGLAVDAAGNLFIADTNNRRIRKVTPGGIISTVAGTGARGYSGDGGPATAAQLKLPSGVRADAAGNLFIADYDSNCIRKVTPDGIISTVAGSDAKWGFSGDGGPATSAQLSWPTGVAMDSAGRLLIADNEAALGVIRKVTPNGWLWKVAEIPFSFGLASDTAGNIFVTDGNWMVYKATPDGVVSTVAGTRPGFSGDGGPATSAQIQTPFGITMDTAGNLFFAEAENNRIRKVTPGGTISTVAGSGHPSEHGFSGDGGPATSARLNQPYGVAVDAAGSLFIADTYNHRIRKVAPGGVISTVAGNGAYGFSGDGGLATSAQLHMPMGVTLDAAGNLWIADTYNHCIRKVTPDGIISTVAGNGAYGFSGDGGPATSAQLYSPVALAVDVAGNLFIADTANNRVRKVAGPTSIAMNLTLKAGGSATAGTAESGAATQVGYAAVDIDTGAVPYGTAVFSYRQNGVTVSETGVPASPPTTSARIFIDYRFSADAIPGRLSAGRVHINTGIAVVNHGTLSADVTYTLRNMAGTTIAVGHGTLVAAAHFAKFIDQLSQVAPDFVLPSNFQAATQFASLEISSNRPLSILALRMTTNQRGEALFTTTPVADLPRANNGGAAFFPQFVDGGGYTTSIVLLNTSGAVETGILQIFDDNGNPLLMREVSGVADFAFRYTIASGGLARLQTDGSPAAARIGWAQLTPDPGTLTPIGAGVFGYNPGNFLLTESGIPASAATTHARIHVDLSGRHNTGLAIANPANALASIDITAYQTDGVTAAGASRGPLRLPANGHASRFANEFVDGLPAGFTGVLDVVSTTPFAALTVRSLYNERDEFLLATFPIADMTLPAPAPIVFPQIADGGGYATQFILIGAGGASNVTLTFLGDDGKPLAVGK